NTILRPAMGEHSLLLVDEDDHQRTRRLLMPAFNGAALRGYAALVGELARAEVDRWPIGPTFRAMPRMQAITLEVILRVVFGVSDEARLRRLRPLVARLVDVGPTIMLGLFYPGLQRYRPWRSYLTAKSKVDELLYAQIAERRGQTDLADRTDVLSRLLTTGGADAEPLSDAELRDQLVTLLLAGHETTATALSWTLHELARHPDVQRDAARAADDGDDEYLGAVVKEAMRLRPVISQVA
ncbi:MAG: cytochrome P450, partial [Actinophytocola sp.]|nr:cytochrome P450 [Actinophytocola sp.]